MSDRVGEILHHTIIILLSISCVLLQAVSGYSKSYPVGSYDNLLRDFAPLSAMVEGVSGYSLVLDKGKGHGVKKGDLFEIYDRGAPVSKPDHGDIIGYLKKPLATVQVTRPEDSKSICEVVSIHGPLSAGQAAMRFSDMTAAFVDKSDPESAHRFRRDLERDMSNLVWLDPSDFPSDVMDFQAMKSLGIDLLFALEKDGLKVYGPDLALLSEYPLDIEGPGSITKNLDRAGEVEQHDADRDFKNDIKGFDLASARLLGHLPEGAIQVDILDLNGDDSLEIVYLMPSGLYVAPFRESARPASYVFFGPGRLVGFSAAETGGWIMLNALMDRVGMRSMLLSYRNCMLSLIEHDVNLWLAFVDRNGDGTKESPLGQSFDADVMFGPKLFLMEPGLQGLKYKKRIRSQEDFSVMRSIWSDLNGNGHPELCTIDQSDKLRVYEMGQLLWSSSNTVFQQLPDGGVSIGFVSTDLDGNGRKELVFSEVSGDKGALPGDRLMILGWVDGEYVLKSMTPPVGGRICGLAAVQDELITGIVRADQEIDGKSESFLYSLDCAGMKNIVSKDP